MGAVAGCIFSFVLGALLGVLVTALLTISKEE